MSVVIDLDSVDRTYRNGTRALHGVSLKVEEGARFSLLGANGAGKSTLIRILTGLAYRDSGLVSVAGMDPGTRPRELQKRIGVVLQDGSMEPVANARNMLMLQAGLFGFSRSRARERVNFLLESFNLEDHASKPSSELSGGNRRRLHCALALVHSPRLLFLDEPGTGLDPDGRRRLWQILDEFGSNEQITIVFCTQNWDEAERRTDSMALLHEGRCRFSGPVEDFKTMVSGVSNGNEGLEDCYLNWLDAQGEPAPAQSEEVKK